MMQRLLENLHEALAMVQRLAGLLIQVRAKLVNTSSSRNRAKSIRSVPAVFFTAFVWAEPPTRETDSPTLTAGR